MNLSPLALQKFFDNNGAPLVGGQLFTYIAGTTTKIATYKDQAGTPNTNPIVLDYRGEANVWLDVTKTYKFTLAPAGDTDPPTRPIWTVDNITAAMGYSDVIAAITATVTQSFIGMVLYPRSAEEIAASITPADYSKIYGDPQRSTWYALGDQSYSYPGDAATFVDTTHFTLVGDRTADYVFNVRTQLRGITGSVSGRVLSSAFGAGITTVTMQMDENNNVPADLLRSHIQLYPSLSHFNTFKQSVNVAYTAISIYNPNTGGAATARLGISSDPDAGLFVGCAGTNFSGSYFPGQGFTGRLAFIYTTTLGGAFVPTPLVFAIADSPRFVIDCGVSAAPAPMRSINAFEHLSMHSSLTLGGAYQTWRRTVSAAGTRMGYFGFDSNNVNDNLSLVNETATGAIRIISNNGNIALSATGGAATSLSLQASKYSWNTPSIGNFANDAAAAAGGVAVTEMYRNGSVMMMRIV